METVAMAQRELSRGAVLALVASGKWTLRRAAEQMGMSLRQSRRLLRRYEQGGTAALAHGNRLDARIVQRVLELVKGAYSGFNDTHLWEALGGRASLRMSRESLRRLLRRHGVAPKRRRRPRQHRRRREPSAWRGAMVQWDGSPHRWIGPEGPQWSLMGAVDDADGTVVWALFVPTENGVSYLRLLDGVVREAGIPQSVYEDQHGALQRNDGHWSLEEQLRGEQDPTQVGMVLRELGIRTIVARSAQGKGRIERFFGVAQDRLAAELAHRGLTTIEQANEYLQTYWIADFNRRFGRQPKQSESLYRPAKGLDLKAILSFRYTRTVAADNTVKLGDLTLQIPPGPRNRSYAKARVDIRQHLDGSWTVYRQGHVIAQHASTGLVEPYRTRIRRRAARLAKADETLLVYFKETA
jgi:transposase